MQRIDGHPDLPDLAVGEGVVGIVADLRRKVEGDAQAGLSLVQQIFVAVVGLLRRRKSRVLAHGPKTPPVHGGLNPARKRKFPGKPQIPAVIGVFDVERGGEIFQRDMGGGLKRGLPFG